MSIYDREYSHEGYTGRGGARMRFAAPSLPPVTMLFLIINVAVFLVSFVIPPIERLCISLFSVYPASWGYVLQVWRLVTYQFLHGTIIHIFFNMLILFYFGPVLEKLWGSNRFLRFYLICGAMGGALYTALAMGGVLGAFPLIGASGAIYGMLAAGAILFPNVRVLLMFVLPVSLRVAAIIAACISLGMFIRGSNAGGNAAHLAGMAAGVVYVLWKPWQAKFQAGAQSGRWEKKVSDERAFQGEVDRILAKVHRSGVGSLSRKEKRILQEATQREQGR